ncbi:hypothetical protein [Flavobacterium sp.]|uniref:hypothetical protein n=1 Tax=Flavobacterium sp. TaxID=239 RepID=UPI003750EAFC
MEIINLTNSKLFNSLLEINYQEKIIDLHNDYELKNIIFQDNYKLKLILKNNNSENQIALIFENFEFIDFDIPIIQDLTLDNFYRGRYEFENKLFDDFNNKKCFYIEFYENGKLNLLCSDLTLKII